MSDSVTDIVEKRGIREVLHFTTNLGFLGCLAKGSVLPRRRLTQDELLEHILTLNAPFRTEQALWFDRSQDWIDYVNLSVSEITTNLFSHSMKWHRGKNIFWVIMSFEPTLLSDQGVFFSTTNNIYPNTNRQLGAVGLEALFAPAVSRKGNWVAKRNARASHLPTCEQAEILYPGSLSMDYLRKVYVREGDDADLVHTMLMTYSRRTVKIEIDQGKFHGAPN